MATEVKMAKTPEERRAYKARLWQRPEGDAFDVEEIRRAIDKEEWEEADESTDSYGQVRRIWLGTVFGVTPSGKVYAPFACSNVAGCATCKGRGVILTVRERVAKKWSTKHAKARALWQKLGRTWDYGDPPTKPLLAAQRAFHNYQKVTRSCTACGGLGSREAYLDELWQEHHEKLFEDYGLSFECGDSGDYFAAEYRDTPDEDEEETEDEEESHDA